MREIHGPLIKISFQEGTIDTNLSAFENGYFTHITIPENILEGRQEGRQEQRYLDPENWKQRQERERQEGIRWLQEYVRKLQRERQERERQERGRRQEWYVVLGVPEKSSESDVKKAYRMCCNKYHPDKHLLPGKKEEMEEKMKQVNIAYREYKKKIK